MPSRSINVVTNGRISFFKFNFILFMAVLGLRFCARAFPSCGKWGPLFIVVRGPLTIAASPAAEHRLQIPRHVGSSQTRARTRVPCTGRQILNHCATREAPRRLFLILALPSLSRLNTLIQILTLFLNFMGMEL